MWVEYCNRDNISDDFEAWIRNLQLGSRHWSIWRVLSDLYTLYNSLSLSIW